MEKIYFVTGNEGKLREAREILDTEIESFSINLPEIQALEVLEVVKDKAQRAYDEIKKPVLIEDTGIYVESWNNFPGALIKWMMKTLDCQGIAKIIQPFENKNAYAETIVCFYDGEEFNIFIGKTEGKIVSPRGENGFGWDPIFEVGDSSKTFAEMTNEEKNNISMRKIALEKLKEFLQDEK